MGDALIVCRFFHFSATLLLFGGCVFTGLLAPDGLRKTLGPRLLWPMTILVAIAVVTSFAWLGLEAGEIGEGWADTVNPATIGAVLTETSFGQVWTARLALAVVLAVLLIVPRLRVRATIGVSALMLVTLGLVGHAAMQEGSVGWVHRANDALHLLAAGFWIGSLPPLLYCLGRWRDPELRATIGAALRRFSGLGHFAVALVLGTGVANAAFILGKPPVDPSSPYQRLLLIKIALVGLMVAMALVNRYVVVPRLAKGPQAMRAMIFGTAAELVVSGVVVALVSAFGTFDPI